jgi:ABC-type uncharacterized transport system involved in gliding motility auxiliary subunit
MGDTLSPAAYNRFKSYLDQGGKLLVMESGMLLSPQGPFASPRSIAFNRLLEPFGVTINPDLVYDLRANQMVAIPTGFLRVLRPYPYFLRAQSTRLSPVNADLGELGLAWTSSLTITAAKEGTVTPLFLTSEAAGVSSEFAFLDPGQQFSTAGLATRVVAAQLTPEQSSARLIVVGNSMLASDEMLQRNPENLAFVLNAVDWLAQDEALIAIRSKDRRPPPLVFSSDAVKQGVKYANLTGVPLLLAVAGLVHLARRRRLAQRPYRPGEHS